MGGRAGVTRGYACTPYMHDHESVGIKEAWARSENVRELHFVTANFSDDGKLYFAPRANHYILAKVADCAIASGEVSGRRCAGASFVFGVDESLFERETEGERNFVSIYYTEYGDTANAMGEIARVVGKSGRVGSAAHAHMGYYCGVPPRLEFPFSDSIMVLEVSGGHQGVNKYCERTRRDVTRRGITMTSLIGLSMLDTLK